MRPLFKEKVSKFGSLISLIALTAMLAVFSLILPEFLSSTSGRLFAAVWAVMGILAFSAHSRRLTMKQRTDMNILRLVSVEKKERRMPKAAPLRRFMRS